MGCKQLQTLAISPPPAAPSVSDLLIQRSGSNLVGCGCLDRNELCKYTSKFQWALVSERVGLCLDLNMVRMSVCSVQQNLCHRDPFALRIVISPLGSSTMISGQSAKAPKSWSPWRCGSLQAPCHGALACVCARVCIVCVCTCVLACTPQSSEPQKR